jgi:O-antigen/teichoic acid export membrane protein
MTLDLSSTKTKVARGVVWTTAANWGCQLLSFGVYTGLARLLNPQAFGLVAIAGVYVAFVQVFVTQGFGMAIIQRGQVEREHLDSALWIAVATASLFCLLTLLLGGQIAHFFGEPRVAPVIRLLSFTLLFYALSSVPMAILTRELAFGALAIRSVLATVVSGAVGLVMAFRGWGVWSLVGQQIVNAVLGCIFLWWAVPWRPSLRLSPRHLRDLYGFSLSITGNDILWFFTQKSDQTLVGYGFGPSGLGPYSLASRLTTLLAEGVIQPLQSVAFPVFSKIQSERERFERALHKFCEMSSLVSFPMFAGIIAVAPELVPSLFGAKWAAAIPILQILAAYGVLRSAFGFLHPLMLSKGRAGLYFLMFVIQSALTFAGCLVAVQWSTSAIALSTVVTMLVFEIFVLIVLMKMMEVRVKALLKTFMFPALSSASMMAVVMLLRGSITKRLAPGISLAICVATGAVIYILTALYARPDLVMAVLEVIRESLSRLTKGSPNGDTEQVQGYATVMTTESSKD